MVCKISVQALVLGAVGLVLSAGSASSLEGSDILVPGTRLTYEYTPSDGDPSQYTDMFLGSFGPWQIFQETNKEAAVYAESTYSLIYLSCEDGEIASDLEYVDSLRTRLNVIPEGRTMDIRGPYGNYSVSMSEERNFVLSGSGKMVLRVKSANLQNSYDDSVDVFTSALQGTLLVGVDWADGSNDTLLDISAPDEPLAPLTQERVMELCPAIFTDKDGNAPKRK